jgi:hypothetical protein
MSIHRLAWGGLVQRSFGQPGLNAYKAQPCWCLKHTDSARLNEVLVSSICIVKPSYRVLALTEYRCSTPCFFPDVSTDNLSGNHNGYLQQRCRCDLA